VEVPASLEALQLTPAEIAQGVKWHAQGITPAKIVERILMARKLTAGTGAPTPDEMTAAIKVRNETGKWPGEGSGKP
jgi:hypothetical protein